VGVTVALTLNGATVPVELDDCALATIAAAVADQTSAAAPPTGSPYLTVAETATYLRTSRQAVDDMLSAGKLPRRKAGRRTLIARADVEAYLVERRTW
jgi:excisionase family DNA binding protein